MDERGAEMQTDSPTKNVVYPTFGTNVRKDSAQALDQSALISSKQAVINYLRTTFKGIVRDAAEPGWIETSEGEGHFDAKRPTHGAYNQFIGYYADGKPNFFLRHQIDQLKSKRQYTRNAIELRCDALGLAIYVSGLTQIDPATRVAREGVRVVVYHNTSLTPEPVQAVKNAEELVEKLHHILITTYNQLSRDYNLAGYTGDFLTLTSSHKALPNIRIDMQS
ncbi:hypothetical protein [Pseudomonas sp.]|uniref:hypothetical protein n=1 Tax=Pseudomonas sp. TaxID=306 RepID=UPI00290B1A70|nr:hypothetical protein [Pseudomonas sp.]MDU4254575.1 hypothetical protein [Pseudomonas sp.]